MTEEWVRTKSPTSTREWRHFKIFFHHGVLPIFLSFPCIFPSFSMDIFSFSGYFSFYFILRLWIQSEKGVCNGPFFLVMWPPGSLVPYLVVCHHLWWWLYILHQFPLNYVENTFVPMYKPPYWLGQVYLGVNKFSPVKPSFTSLHFLHLISPIPSNAVKKIPLQTHPCLLSTTMSMIHK